MAYHFPRPEYRHDLLRWTQRVADALRAQPGLLQVGDFDDPANGRIFAISIWESTERFRAGWERAMASLGTEPPYDLWETRPLEVVALAELDEPTAMTQPGR
jgi:hypothetical protein